MVTFDVLKNFRDRIRLKTFLIDLFRYYRINLVYIINYIYISFTVGFPAPIHFHFVFIIQIYRFYQSTHPHHIHHIFHWTKGFRFKSMWILFDKDKIYKSYFYWIIIKKKPLWKTFRYTIWYSLCVQWQKVLVHSIRIMDLQKIQANEKENRFETVLDLLLYNVWMCVALQPKSQTLILYESICFIYYV